MILVSSGVKGFHAMGFVFLEVEVGAVAFAAGTLELVLWAQALKTTAMHTTIQLNIFMMIQFTTTYVIIIGARC
jgi:hypothetical protein